MSSDMDRTRLATGALDLRNHEEILREAMANHVNVIEDPERFDKQVRSAMLHMEEPYLRVVEEMLAKNTVTLLDFYHAVRDPEAMLNSRD